MDKRSKPPDAVKRLPRKTGTVLMEIGGLLCLMSIIVFILGFLWIGVIVSGSGAIIFLAGFLRRLLN
jgi:uncharacterized membrane protein